MRWPSGDSQQRDPLDQRGTGQREWLQHGLHQQSKSPKKGKDKEKDGKVKGKSGKGKGKGGKGKGKGRDKGQEKKDPKAFTIQELGEELKEIRQ